VSKSNKVEIQREGETERRRERCNEINNELFFGVSGFYAGRSACRRNVAGVSQGLALILENIMGDVISFAGKGGGRW